MNNAQYQQMGGMTGMPGAQQMGYPQQMSQPGVTSPMVNQNGQYAPGQFPGSQMNPPPYQQSQYMQQAQAPAAQAKPQSTVVEVIRSNYTTISLFEVSGGYDPAQQYPKALCFVMGVPGVKDQSKQSGRSYLQANKIVMKFSTQEIRSLGQSLIGIATFKQAAANFVKHSDPSKNAYTQGNAAQAQAKKLEAKFDPAKANIVITMNYGQNNVLIPVPLPDAFGLGHDLINIGNFADAKLAEYKIAHKVGKEEITGIDYDPAGVDDGIQGYSVGQMGQAQGQPQPQAQQMGAPQYQGQPQGQPQVQQMGVPQYQGQPQAQPQMQYQQPGMVIQPMGMPGAQ